MFARELGVRSVQRRTHVSATESERVCTRTWRSERTKMNACECNGKGDDMRLRNIPRAEGVLQAHPIVIKEENNQKGKWQ